MNLKLKLGGRARYWIQAAFGVAVIVALLGVLDLGNIADQLGGTDWALALPAIAVLVLVHLAQVQAWRSLSVRLFGRSLPFVVASSTYYVGQALGSVTPGNVGADVYRFQRLKSENVQWQTIAAPILGQRLLSYGTLLMLGALSVLFAADPSIRSLSSPGLVLIVISLLAGSVVLAAPLRQFFIGKGSSLLTRLGMKLGLESVPRRQAVMPAVLLSILFHVVSILAAYVLLLSVHGNVNMLDGLKVLTLARVASLLPFAPYGLGLQEGALALALPTIGVSAEAALAVSLLSRLAMMSTVLTGLVILAAGKLSALSLQHWRWRFARSAVTSKAGGSAIGENLDE